jgi:eukaryotic-like serine/threonine-protein kinase
MAYKDWQKVREVFDAALRQEPQDRQNYLNEACGDDKDLLTEVESLFSSFHKSDDFMETPAVAHVADIIESETKKLESGTRFGHYEIIRQIGIGGMGEVYLAEDQRLDRRVAIKILKEKFSQDESNLKRFVREAKAASALNHPNILIIHEIGESQGAHYIVSEFIEGRTLREVLSESHMSLEKVLDLAIQITSALFVAHGAHLVHRDIKPENVMVRPDGYVKVLDFGLAKLVAQETKPLVGLEDATIRNQTAKGVILGTVNYMSPEQALGRKVDHRSDIFSLGLVLYEMATGKRAFAGATAIETIDQILHAQPEAVRRLNHRVPAELERIIRKCLEKDRECRYQSAGELLTELRNLRRDSSQPSVITERSLRETLIRPRHNVYVLLALAILSVLGTAVYWLVTNDKAIDSVAVLPFTNESADPNLEYLSEGITENLINRLSQVPELRVVPRSTVFRYKGPNVDPLASARALGVRTVIVGKIAQRGETLSIQTELIDVTNESQLWGEQYNRRPTDLLTVQDDIAKGIVEKLRLRLSSTEQQRLTRRYTGSVEAYQLYLRGRYFWNKRTGEGMKKGIEYFRQAIDLDPGYSLAYAGLADSYNFLGAFGIAVLPPGEAMPKAKSAAIKALEIDNSLAEAHTSLAFISLYYDWDWSAAERGFHRAIELNPNYAPAHQWYSHLLMARGRTRESIVEAKRAVELDPLSLAANMNLGWQYHWARQYDLAVEQLRKTLEMEPNFEQGRWGLGLAYEGKGLFEEAAKEFQKAVALSGGNPVYLASLGHAYAIGGRKADAMRILDELEERSKLSYVPPYWMATLCTGLGEKDKAFRWLDKAHEERSGGLSWLGVDPRLDSLRSDARLAALSQRVGLSS